MAMRLSAELAAKLHCFFAWILLLAALLCGTGVYLLRIGPPVCAETCAQHDIIAVHSALAESAPSDAMRPCDLAPWQSLLTPARHSAPLGNRESAHLCTHQPKWAMLSSCARWHLLSSPEQDTFSDAGAIAPRARLQARLRALGAKRDSAELAPAFPCIAGWLTRTPTALWLMRTLVAVS